MSGDALLQGPESFFFFFWVGGGKETAVEENKIESFHWLSNFLLKALTCDDCNSMNCNFSQALACDDFMNCNFPQMPWPSMTVCIK